MYWMIAERRYKVIPGAEPLVARNYLILYLENTVSLFSFRMSAEKIFSFRESFILG